MTGRKHAVNVLFTDAEYSKLVMQAAELTVREGRRVSIAELVRRLVLSGSEDLPDKARMDQQWVGEDQRV